MEITILRETRADDSQAVLAIRKIEWEDNDITYELVVVEGDHENKFLRKEFKTEEDAIKAFEEDEKQFLVDYEGTQY